MNFSVLRDFLIKAGEGEIEILKLYEVKIGCFAFSQQKLPGYDSERPVSELEELGLPSDADLTSGRGVGLKPGEFSYTVFAELLEALKSHPNIFGLSVDKPQRPLSSTLGVHRLIAGEELRFQINLPERLQRFRSGLELAEPKIEQVGVITSGSLFACYAELSKFPQYTWFAQEYRELLQQTIEQRGKIHCIVVPPCPLGRSVYVAVLPPSAAEPKKRFHFFEEDLVLLLRGPEGLEKLAGTILSIFSFDLERFFRIMLARRSVELYMVEIFNEFGILTGSFKALLRTKWWRVLGRHNRWASARTSLSNIHVRLVGYGSAEAIYDRDVAAFPRTIEKNPYISVWSGYFARLFERSSIPGFLVSSLQYFERELQLFGHKRVILTASLVSASIAALVSVLIAMLRHL